MFDQVTIIKCENCGVFRDASHPIQCCPQCDKDGYGARFTDLRTTQQRTYLLGHDFYSGKLFVWTNGVVAGVDRYWFSEVVSSHADGLVRRINDLERENKDVLAENALLRRRLEGKS